MKRRIEVTYLARVEGEGALTLETEAGQVTRARLEIFEPPRFFEALLVGRDHSQAPDITSRICGICPVAYQITATQAMEQALQVQVPPEIQLLKRLIYCGEWIESHLLHIFLLHLPDFLGLDDSLKLAKQNPQAVQTALNLKKLGNELVTAVGGREIHPINLAVGGFYQAPSPQALRALLPRLCQAREDLQRLLPLLRGLEFPDFVQDYLFVALRSDQGYPLEGGRLITSDGLDIAKEDYETQFQEIQVEGSHALHSLHQGQPYLVGPLARFALNYDRLSPACQEIAQGLGLGPEPVRNPFQSILVRAVEAYYALEEASRLIEEYQRPSQSRVEALPGAGVGYGVSEAPRGILYHRYALDSQGKILQAKIVPPTSQNLPRIEADLKAFAQPRLELDDARLTWALEQAIRNYDPCISCATHFLKLHRP